MLDPARRHMIFVGDLFSQPHNAYYEAGAGGGNAFGKHY